MPNPAGSGRGAAGAAADLLEPIVEPRFGIDGWSYAGTVLEDRFAPQIEAELAQTVHMICGGLATAWNYRRAVQLLEGQGAYTQAYAVLEAWAAEGPDPEPGLAKTRARLLAAVRRQRAEETP